MLTERTVLGQVALFGALRSAFERGVVMSTATFAPPPFLPALAVEHPYGAPPKSTWWRPFVVAIAALMVGPAMVFIVAFLALLIAPVCVLAAPLIAATLFWPAHKARVAREREDRARFRNAYA